MCDTAFFEHSLIAYFFFFSISTLFLYEWFIQHYAADFEPNPELTEEVLNFAKLKMGEKHLSMKNLINKEVKHRASGVLSSSLTFPF